jgi:hypothetical protein
MSKRPDSERPRSTPSSAGPQASRSRVHFAGAHRDRRAATCQITRAVRAHRAETRRSASMSGPVCARAAFAQRRGSCGEHVIDLLTDRPFRPRSSSSPRRPTVAPALKTLPTLSALRNDGADTLRSAMTCASLRTRSATRRVRAQHTSVTTKGRCVRIGSDDAAPTSAIPRAYTDPETAASVFASTRRGALRRRRLQAGATSERTSDLTTPKGFIVRSTRWAVVSSKPHGPCS